MCEACHALADPQPSRLRRFGVRIRLAIGRPIWWLLYPAYRERLLRMNVSELLSAVRVEDAAVEGEIHATHQRRVRRRKGEGK